MTITAAVDGSSLGNPGPAGWAWVISEDCWDAGGWPSGTNNLGELNAVLELLKATAQAGLADEDLHILADSQYAINVISKWSPGWKKRGWVKADKKPIKNLELIQEIDRAMQGRTVTFEWVKGHAGHPLNERADDAARSARKLIAMVAPFLADRGSLHPRKARRRDSNPPRQQLILPRQAGKFRETRQRWKRRKKHSNVNSLRHGFAQTLLPSKRSKPPAAYASGTTVLLPRVWKDAHPSMRSPHISRSVVCRAQATITTPPQAIRMHGSSPTF